MKFRTTLFSAGKTATGIDVPVEVVESFGAGKRVPVLVTINGYTYRNTVAVYGGKFMVGVSAEHRAGAGISAGDEIEVTMDPDTEPREAHIPDDLAKALAKDKAAGTFFESLSYSNKRQHVLSIEGAKTAETRQRRIEKAIALFREGRV